MTDGSGVNVSGISSAPLVWDIDGDGNNDLIARTGASLHLYIADPDEPVSQLPAGDDLSAGGARVADDNAECALVLLRGKSPHLAVLENGSILLYPLHLQGDVNRDGTVNISDISKIAKVWELTDEDPDWNPACNLRLASPGSGEIIDIGDVSRASKNWELEE